MGSLVLVTALHEVVSDQHTHTHTRRERRRDRQTTGGMCNNRPHRMSEMTCGEAVANRLLLTADCWLCSGSDARRRQCDWPGSGPSDWSAAARCAPAGPLCQHVTTCEPRPGCCPHPHLPVSTTTTSRQTQTVRQWCCWCIADSAPGTTDTDFALTVV